MNIRESKAYRYAQQCVDPMNSGVGIYVKKQAQAWIDIADGKDAEAYTDQDAAEKIFKLMKVMNHPDLHVSIYDGLEDYAWLLIVAVFCTKAKTDNSRYYRTALLEIARKNFKTFNSAVIFILAMLTEPKFSRFFSVAPDLKLSKELQLAIRKIIKCSPALSDAKVFKLLRSEIRCLLTDSDYTPLAYSEDKMDGKLANVFLADEAGALDSYPVEAMRSSQITLLNKLGIIISTQYPNDDNVMIDEIDRAKKTLDGLMPDRRYFALLYEPDDKYLSGDQWMTEDNIIRQANPVATAHPYIFDELKNMRALAVLYENKRENYLCKHNNIKYKGLGVEGYIEITKVRECRTDLPDSFWAGKRVYLGIDFSQSDDNTSVAMACFHDGKICAKVWGFIPGGKIDLKTNREGVNYRNLLASGCCFACGQETIDYQFVENFVLSLPEKYGVEIVQLGFDRYNAISSVQKWESAAEPIECVEIKQHSSVLHVPTKLLREYILNRQFCYGDNLMLEINFQNARCTKDTNMNMYVNKKKSVGKVDMVVSLINAVYLLNLAEIMAVENWGVQVI